MPQSKYSITPAIPMIKPVSRTLLRALFMLIPIFGLSLPAAAVTVDGLYNVEVPVKGSSPGQLKAGYAEGLSRVFLRVSGNSDVLRQGEVRALLEDADKLLQSYQFLRADGQGGDRLKMTFGAVGVNKALASVDAPVWGANRPLTLAWVAVQDNRGRQLVTNATDGSAGSDTQWQQAFSKAAARRGVPVALPPAQIAGDRQLLSEVWGQFMGSIREASSELDHDLLATVRISRDGGGWQASWLVEGRGVDDVENSVRGSNPDDVANGVVDAWADMLGSKYAVAAGDVTDSAQVDIVIEGIGNLTDYAAVNASLNKMTPVLRAGAVKVNAESATVRVAFSGELSQVQEYMALDQRFKQVAAPKVAVASPEPKQTEQDTDTTDAVDTGENTDKQDADTTEDTGSEEDALSYQTAASGSDQARSFESLYPVLHYRWQPGSAVKQEAGE